MKICPNCKTENPSKATLCMKCGTLLVDEEELTVEEKLQRELSQAQDEIVLLKSALDAALKNNVAKDLEKERDSLSKENERLKVLVGEMANKAKGLEERLKSVGNELSSSKNSIQKLKERIRELENNAKKKHSKWKVLSIVLMILLLCGGCFLLYALDNRYTEQPGGYENSGPEIDTLRLAIEQLQASRDSLLVVIQGSDSVQVKSLMRLKALQEKFDSLKDVNDKLNSIKTFEGHDAEYWYVQYRKENSSKMHKGHDAKYWYEQYQNKNSSSMYKGQSAEYWYKNRLYKGKSAEEWYNEYMGY